MAQSSALYQPSILELARAGNFRAIAYWINSILAPQGLSIQTASDRSGRLNILVDLPQLRSRQQGMQLRQALVRMICYRLWTLNSPVIREVRISARIAGEASVLWHQSVRIITPANRERRRSQPVFRRRRGSRLWFQILRSSFVSRLAVAAFFLCYWMYYWQIAGSHTPARPVATPTLAIPEGSDSSGQPSLKGQMRVNLQAFGSFGSVASPDPSVASQVPELFQGTVVRSLPAVGTEKVVALTFDDGPWESSTEQVLDILQQANIKATFFWVGLHIQRHPEIAQKVVAAGHAIGNHTWRHVLQTVDTATAAEEINNTAKLIYDTTGVRTQLFRPPGGNLAGELAAYAKQQQHAITLWSVDSQDYYVSAPLIVDNVLRQVRPGGIILLHDGGGNRTATVQALPQIITTLQRQGYRFVTVPELLELQAKAASSGRSH